MTTAPCIQLVDQQNRRRKSHVVDADGQPICGPLNVPLTPGEYWLQTTLDDTPTCGWCRILLETP